MSGIVKHLDTAGLQQARQQCQNGIRTFQGSVQEMKNIARGAMENWEGEGRTEFEYQFRLLAGRFDDLEEELYRIYEELLDAEAAYIDADEEMKKAMKMQGG